MPLRRVNYEEKKLEPRNYYRSPFCLSHNLSLTRAKNLHFIFISCFKILFPFRFRFAEFWHWLAQRSFFLGEADQKERSLCEQDWLKSVVWIGRNSRESRTWSLEAWGMTHRRNGVWTGRNPPIFFLLSESFMLSTEIENSESDYIYWTAGTLIVVKVSSCWRFLIFSNKNETPVSVTSHYLYVKLTSLQRTRIFVVDN